MIREPWRREPYVAVALAVALSALGAAAGHPAAFVLAVLVWGGRHAVQLYRLADWLRNGKRGRRPVACGPWQEICGDLDALQRRNRKKKRPASIIGRLTQVAAAIPDATVVLEGGDVIARINPAAERMVGLGSPRDIGQPLTNLVRAPALSE